MVNDKLDSLASSSLLGRGLALPGADKLVSRKEALPEKKLSGLHLQTFGFVYMDTPFVHTALLHKNGNVHFLLYRTRSLI